MYFEDFISEIGNKKIKIYVDMDGVIADYVVGDPYDYDKKRPLRSNIKNLEEVSKMENVDVYILSASRMNCGVDEKNVWLDINAPFFKKENRNILPRELYNFEKSSEELKVDFIRNIERDGSQIIIIDDDPMILKTIKKEFPDVIVLKDTALVD